MNANILVVEDDLNIQELIYEFLQAHGHTVTLANDGLEGWDKFQQGNFDLILLDVMMPNLDGMFLGKMIRSKSQVPIIYLTALNDEENQVKAFDNLADDYITKPFSFSILTRRVDAVLRRVYPHENKNIITYKNITLDQEGYKVTVSNEEIDLTSKEFELLLLFLKNKGRVLTREILLQQIWGYDFFGDTRVVDAHIKNLRKKVGSDVVRTVKGIGYVVE
ncbi:MAG: two-component response regulator [Bacillales bacterium]|jgi:two-component system response regulator VanR|nr:two-component response regulator [Bacillales bacterium]